MPNVTTSIFVCMCVLNLSFYHQEESFSSEQSSEADCGRRMTAAEEKLSSEHASVSDCDRRNLSSEPPPDSDCASTLRFNRTQGEWIDLLQDRLRHRLRHYDKREEHVIEVLHLNSLLYKAETTLLFFSLLQKIL